MCLNDIHDLSCVCVPNAGDLYVVNNDSDTKLNL